MALLAAIKGRGAAKDHNPYAEEHDAESLVTLNLYGIGNNKYGRLATNDSLSKYEWKQSYTVADAPVRFTDLACGAGHALALTAEGALYTWGKCHFGQLGFGEEDQDRWLPSRLVTADVAAIGAGDSFSFYVDRDGHVYSFGCGYYGPLGLGTEKTCVTPTRISFFDAIPIRQVTGGAFHSLFLAQDGRAFACGRNHCGQLGLGSDTTKNVSVPVLVDIGDRRAIAVAAGLSCSVVLTEAGDCYWFGAKNEQGAQARKPERLPLPGPVRKACCSNTSIVALLEDGSVWQFREGLDKDLCIPARIIDIVAGEMHFIARDERGTLWSWGFSAYQGKLGFGVNATVTPDPTPMSVTVPLNIFHMAAGSNHSFCLVNSPDGPTGDGGQTMPLTK
mmetsp:Transcript_13513/g.38399  ORF Transcript_13513/g.38399 Transcript_13513/m.38399 type:complete len:390 (+) Transcript_13513:16-1185(+)